MPIEAASIKIGVTADTKEAEAGLERVGHAVDQAGEHAGRFGRAAEGLTSGLKRIGETALGFELGRGIEEAPAKLLEMVNAAAEDEAAMTRLRTAVDNTSGGWTQYSDEVTKAIEEGGKLAFSHEATANALTLLTSETGSSEEAIKRLSSAQNLARGTGMDLGAASKLLGKLTDQNIGVLKRYGISVEKGASAQDLLNKVDARFGGQAAKFAETGAGQWEVAKIAMHEVGVQIGSFLLPGLTKLAVFVAGTLAPLLSTLVTIVGGALSSAFDAISAVLSGPLTKAFSVITGAVGGFISYLRGDAINGMNDMQSALNSVFGGEMATSIVVWATLVGDKIREAFGIARDAITTFIGALQGNWTNSDQISILHRIMGELGLLIRSVVIPAWDALQQVVSGSGKTFDTLSPVIDLVRQHFSDIRRVIGDVLTIVSPFAAILKAVAVGFGKDGLAGVIPGAIQGLKDIRNAFSDLSGVAITLGAALLGALKGVDWSAVGSALMTALGNALSTAGSLATQLVTAIGTALGNVNWSATATTVGGALVGALGTALSTAGSLADSLVSAIGSALGNAKWGDAASTAASALGTAWGALTDAGGYVVSWVSTGLSGIAWGDIPSTIAKGIGDAWGALTDAATYIYTWIVASITSVPWAEIGSAIATFVGQAWSVLTDAAIYLHDWLATGAAGAQYTDIAATISTNLGTALGAVQAGGGGLLSLLLGAVPDLSNIPGLDNLKTLINDMQGYWIQTINNLQLSWQALLDSFGPGSDVVTQFGDVWTNLKPAIEGIGIALGALLVQAGLAISGLVALFSAGLSPAIKITADVVTLALSVISDALQAINRIVGDLVDTVNNIIHGRWLAAWQSLGDVVTTASILVQNLAGDLLTFLNQIFGETVHAIAEPFKNAWDAATGYVSGMAGDIEGKVGSLVGSVQGFFSDMASTVTGTVSGWVGDVVNAVVGLYNSVTTEIGSLYDAVTSKISSMVADSVSFVAGLPGSIRDALGDLYTIGYDAIAGLANGIIDAGASLVAGAIATVTAMIPDFIKSALGISSPSRVLMAIGEDVMAGFTIGIIDGSATTAKAAADAASAVISAFNAALDLGAKIQSGGLTLPSVAATDAFAVSVSAMITSIAATADQMKSHALAAAKAFADAANTVVGFVSAGVDALSKLVDFVRPSDQAIADFKFAVEHLVQSFADSGQLMSVEAVGNARVFSDAAAACVAVLKDGIDGLAALSDFVRPTDVAIASFKFALEKLVRSLSDSGAMFSTDGLTAATAFGTAAQAVVGVLKDGIDGFIALTDFVRPSDHAIADFKFALEDMVRSIADSAATFSTDGLAAAQQFADAAKPIVDLISGGLTAFAALSGGTLATGWQANLDAFGTFVKAVVQRIVTIAGQFKTDGLAAAKQFSDAGKSVFDLMSGAITAITSLGDPKFTIPSSARMDAFQKFVTDVVQKMVDTSASFTADGLAAAKQFADTGKAIFDLLNTASSFSGLPDLGKHFADNLHTFLDNVKLAIDDLIALGAEIGAGLDTATQIAEKINKIVGLLTGGTGGGGGGGAGSGSGGGGGGGGSSYGGGGMLDYHSGGHPIHIIGTKITLPKQGWKGGGLDPQALAAKAAADAAAALQKIKDAAAAAQSAMLAAAQTAAQQWQALMSNLTDLASGATIKKLQADLKMLSEELKLAIAGGAPKLFIDQLKAAITTDQSELTLAGKLMAQAIADGYGPALKAAASDHLGKTALDAAQTVGQGITVQHFALDKFKRHALAALPIITPAKPPYVLPGSDTPPPPPVVDPRGIPPPVIHNHFRVILNSRDISFEVEQDILDDIRIHPAPVGGHLVGAT